MAGCTLRFSHAAKVAQLRFAGGVHAGVGHRGEYRDVQRDQCCAVAEPPFADPLRVMMVFQKMSNGNNNVFSTSDFLEWKRQAGPLAQMAAIISDSHTLGTQDGQWSRSQAGELLRRCFPFWEFPPALGRPFTADEDRPGAGKLYPAQ